MDESDEFGYNYGEDLILSEIQGYIESTYGQHYAGEQEIQLFDYWHSIGILTPVAIGTAIKYLARYGKKEGANRKDLLKAAHYVILAIYAETDFGDEEEFGVVDDSGDGDHAPSVAETQAFGIPATDERVRKFFETLYAKGPNAPQ